ncbi:MAG: FAD-binding oxidoreductase [Bdellovibrionales bacterium]
MLDIENLKVFLKSDQIKQDKELLSVYGNDWLKQWDGKAGLVLFPKTTQEVVQIIHWAKKQKVKLIPSGGRTGLSGGSTALKKEVVVSFDKMNQISDFNSWEQTVCVEAGVITKTLQDYAREQNLYFPVSFASEGSSQIGGNIATNAGGVHVIRYGSMRQQVLGLEVVTGQGEVLQLGKGLIKNAAGYDLKNLFIGSEGTLGFITKAIIKLTTPPKQPQVFLLAVEKRKFLLEIFKNFKNNLQTLAFEVFSDEALKHVLSHNNLSFPMENRAPFYLLMEIEESEQEIALSIFEKEMEEGRIQDGILSQNSIQKNEIWSFRENISESISCYQPYKNDICVPISKMPNFLEDMEALLEKNYPDFEIIWFGHLGDGNLHINILKPEKMKKEDFVQKCEKVNDLLFSLVQKFKGTISAEHGIGLLKKSYLSYSCSEEEIKIMKSLKKVFDPESILNPGKIFDL